MRVWAAVLLGGAPTLAGAQSAFGPTEDYRIPLAPCERTLDTRQVHPPLGTVDLFRGDARLRITMVGVDNYKAQAFAGALPRSPDVTVRVQATTPGDVSEHGYCHDLNRDGSTDFAVALWRHGNGLGASFYDWLIALSSGDSYRFWVVPAMGPSASDFVTFGKVEPVVMVTQSLQQTRGGGTFGEEATYSVYHLWAVRGGELVSADSIDDRFPKWVRWTFKQPNSLPAKSVGDEQRRSHSPPRIVEALP